jgi:hypothetical protein
MTLRAPSASHHSSPPPRPRWDGHWWRMRSAGCSVCAGGITYGNRPWPPASGSGSPGRDSRHRHCLARPREHHAVEAHAPSSVPLLEGSSWPKDQRAALSGTANVRRTRRERGLARGRKKDQLIVKLLKADAPYEEIKHALLELEKQWLSEAKTEAERQQARRSIAEDLVSQAYSFCPREEGGHGEQAHLPMKGRCMPTGTSRRRESRPRLRPHPPTA